MKVKVLKGQSVLCSYQSDNMKLVFKIHINFILYKIKIDLLKKNCLSSYYENTEKNVRSSICQNLNLIKIALSTCKFLHRKNYNVNSN